VRSSSISRGSIGVEGDRLIGVVGTLEPGSVVEATVRIRIPAFEPTGDWYFGPPRLSSYASVETSTLDLFPTYIPPAEVVVDRAQLAVSGSVAPDRVEVGETATFTYLVSNQGPAPARQVLFRMPYLPEQLTLVSTSPDRGTTLPDGSIDLGTLQPGEAAEVAIVVRPAMPGAFPLSPWVTSPSSDVPVTDSWPTLAVPGPAVGSEAISLSLPDLPGKHPRRVAVQVYQSLDPDRALDPANYRVEVLGAGGRARPIPIRSVSFDPMTLSYTVETSRPLPIGRTIRVTARSGGLVDPDGVPIDGDGDFLPGGDFVGLIDVGHSVRYRDTDGDLVALALLGGQIELARRADGQPRSMRLVTTSRLAVLTGRARQAQGGDGLTTLPPYWYEGRAEQLRDRLPAEFLRPIPF
jgi:uncharacterized repeat protein (TIGR01451 family)